MCGFATGQKGGFRGGVRAAAAKASHIHDFYDLLLVQSNGVVKADKMTITRVYFIK